MNNKLLMRWFAILIGVLAVAFTLNVSLYTVDPGHVGVIIRQGNVAQVIAKPGTHWKSPSDQFDLLDIRNQVANVSFRADRSGPATESAAARFSVVWKIDSPSKFYQATQNNNPVVDVQDKLADVSDPALRKLLAKDNEARLFAVSSASATQAFEAAIKPAAEKLGIKLLSVSLADIKLSKAAEKQITDRMLASDSTARQQKESSSETEAEKKIASARTQAANILAAARNKAATIRGESEAKVSDLYAQAAKAAPDFFRFYQTLMSETAALNTNTRLFIVSSDSPWFRLMGKPGSNGPHKKF